MLGFGIPSTGFNPYMSGLDMYGLGGYGAYSSPSSYAPYFNYGNMGGMMGMGMYNPAYWTEIQQQIEKSQLNHSLDINRLLMNNDKTEFKEQYSTIIEKALVNGDINTQIDNLASKIRSGDCDGACVEYDKLKNIIYTKFSSEFAQSRGSIDNGKAVTGIIELLYGKIMSERDGVTVDMRSDIKKYGDTAFTHGFWKALHGKDYTERGAEGALNYIYGTNMTNKAGKKRMEKLGAGCERGLETLTATAVGGGLGSVVGACLSRTKWGAVIGALLGAGGDILWQCSRA